MRSQKLTSLQLLISSLSSFKMMIGDGDVAATIRHMLLTDPDGFGLIRMAAASVLGGRSTWPDPTLETALKTDPDEDVRRAGDA